ncbi:hypothetical protein [Streptomyces sp. WP-1]|uniref:hypothetical protein n=1 Tax=Streptomyces sp. WP-1 TaxID=3041497 RepID=UPI002648F740|nr:hypothetical protein [Streptomyces sp. WP-1]WKE71608.1 hypothetical protein QHG49_22620 [Streptomyces sp. WP-1]
MRALPVRRLASTALSAAVIAAITGPVAVAVDTARGHGEAPASQTALPGAAKLLARVRTLDRAGTLPKPVVELLDRSLTKGRLPAAEAERLGEAAKQAVVRALAAGTAGAQAPGGPTAAAVPAAPVAPAPAAPTAAAPAQAATPASPAAPAKPAPVPSGSESQSALPEPAASPAVPLSPAPRGAARSVPVARDLVSDVLAAVDALVQAAVSDVDQVVAAADTLVDQLLSALGIGVPTPTPTPTTLPSVPAAG